MLKLIYLVALCVCISECKRLDKFVGYKVYRLKPKTEEQNGLLERIEKDQSLLDFWTGVNKVGIPVDVMVPPAMQEDFVGFINQNGIENEILISDIEQEIHNESTHTRAIGGYSFNNYHGLRDIYNWMDDLAVRNPRIVSTFRAGSTYEKREIKGLKISYGYGKRAVFIEGGIHAREWISPATVTYIINELLTSKDNNIKQLAQSFDWYFVPVTNPDGYVYSHEVDRLWRKTRSGNFYCKGSDPNRNWGFHWGESGVTNIRCLENFAGDGPFSEIETYSLSQFIKTIGHKIDVYLAFHSYSQLLLMPYGHTEEHLDNYNDVYAIGKKTIAALSKRYGTRYRVGNIAETIYRASGGSMDWVKATFKVPIAFTYELRDTGRNGFFLPANQIIPNGEEVMDSLVEMFTEANARRMIHLRTVF